MSGKSTLVPKQARSRESLKRLLRAAAAALDEMGLEGATIPRIAARAGLSPASVYRRFRDKDALLRVLLIETLKGSDKHNETVLTVEFAQQHSLPELVRKIIATTLESYRKHVGLIRALTQFSRSHRSGAFRKQVDEMEVRNFRRIVDFLLIKRSEINHPDPEGAASFALMMVALSLREMVILDVLSPEWAPLLPKSDDQLIEELTRAFLSYLGCAAPTP